MSGALDLFLLDDSPQQRRMRAGTPDQVAAAARRNFAQANCPFAVLFQSTGASNSESTWTCRQVSEGISWWRNQTCASSGQVGGCQLFLALVERRLFAEATRLRTDQNSIGEFEIDQSGPICQYRLK